MDKNQISMDEKYMRRCLQLAANGIQGARPNPMVGAVITLPLAPVNAFASVKPEDEPLLGEATIYVSLEPCAHYGKTPPCADLIIKKGVKRVVVGCIDPFAEVKGRGIERIRQAGIEVTVGVLEKECQWLNRRFFTYHAKHRPYIILKWAQTANGFIDDHFQQLAISNNYTKMLNHKLRAEEDAILVGHTTAEREHPKLTVHHWFGPDQSLIVEGGLKTHEAFIAAGLWDEIHVETNHQLTVTNGTQAPHLPSEAQFLSQQNFGHNTLITYKR